METSYGHTTASLLAEIECGTAAEVVTAVRKLTSPPGETYIPPLDEILLEARSLPRGSKSTLQRGDLIEITGPAGSGKTSLVVFLLATSLLPSSIDIPLPPPIQSNDPPISVRLGGKDQHAALLHPTSDRSPIPAIVRRMRSHIEPLVLEALTQYLRPRIITPPIRAAINACVTEALSKLRVVSHKPRWKALTLSLLSILRNGPESGTLDLVICDGFGDAFWPQRWNSEEKGRNGASIRHGIRGGDDIGIRDALGVINELRKDFGAIVVMTTQHINTSTSATQPVPHLEPPFPYPFNPDETDASPSRLALDIQISLAGKVRSLQFPAEITLVEALRALEVQSAIHEARYVGIVRVPGGIEDEQGQETAQKSGVGPGLEKTGRLAVTPAGEKFAFAIGDSGLEPFLKSEE